jgi:hypothetical protein
VVEYYSVQAESFNEYLTPCTNMTILFYRKPGGHRKRNQHEGLLVREIVP